MDLKDKVLEYPWSGVELSSLVNSIVGVWNLKLEYFIKLFLVWQFHFLLWQWLVFSNARYICVCNFVVIDFLNFRIKIFLRFCQNVQIVLCSSLETFKKFARRLFLDGERTGSLGSDPVKRIQIKHWTSFTVTSVHALCNFVLSIRNSFDAASRISSWHLFKIRWRFIRFRQRSWEQRKFGKPWYFIISTIYSRFNFLSGSVMIRVGLEDFWFTVSASISSYSTSVSSFG